jgi:hypothetical protein
LAIGPQPADSAEIPDEDGPGLDFEADDPDELDTEPDAEADFGTDG